MSKADVTNKYINMIETFECDFSLVKQGHNKLSELDKAIKDKTDNRLLKDIELLEELSFNLRHGKLKIIEIAEQQDIDIQSIEEIHYEMKDYMLSADALCLLNYLKIGVNDLTKAVKQLDRKIREER